MQYMGGKGRIAKILAKVMLPLCRGRDGYLEPFVGGGYTFSEMGPHFQYRAAGDVMPDVVLYWKAVANGWLPPERITREEYAELRYAEPSALRAFAGFGCSFGGKWFAGYASQTVDARHPHGHTSVGSRKSTVKKAQAFTGATIRHCGYEAWKFNPTRVVVYCDPPYAGTTTYSGTDGWDVDRFWEWARVCSESGALVFVSEYAAPGGWEPIWSRSVKGSLAAHNNTAAVTEHLFTWGKA